jgi:hypothetical protein
MTAYTVSPSTARKLLPRKLSPSQKESRSPQGVGRKCVASADSVSWKKLKKIRRNEMARAFKGKDRRMITKVKNLLTAVLARDQRALNPKPTTSLSTRQPILDYDDTEGGLQWCAQVLVLTMTEDLAALPQGTFIRQAKEKQKTNRGAPSPG